jgi:hypothetical protein
VAADRTKPRQVVALRVDGFVEEILVAPIAEAEPMSVRRVRALAGEGLVGDRYLRGIGTWSDYPDQSGSDLTLVEAEVLQAVGLSGVDARRNLVTRDVRLNDLVGRRFRIGEVVCRGVRLCEPCAHLELLTGVGVHALTHRAGLRADILVSGEFGVGEYVEVEPDVAGESASAQTSSNRPDIETDVDELSRAEREADGPRDGPVSKSRAVEAGLVRRATSPYPVLAADLG